MELPVLHHVTLTVVDPQASADFYQSLFGPAEVVQRQGPTWTRQRLLWSNGLMLGMTAHATTVTESFDPARVGLDHVGFGCASEADVRGWAARMDELGIEHGPMEDTPYAVVVTGRDPDNIPIEFYWMRVT